jgi:hypothetical protein
MAWFKSRVFWVPSCLRVKSCYEVCSGYHPSQAASASAKGDRPWDKTCRDGWDLVPFFSFSKNSARYSNIFICDDSLHFVAPSVFRCTGVCHTLHATK